MLSIDILRGQRDNRQACMQPELNPCTTYGPLSTEGVISEHRDWNNL